MHGAGDWGAGSCEPSTRISACSGASSPSPDGVMTEYSDRWKPESCNLSSFSSSVPSSVTTSVGSCSISAARPASHRYDAAFFWGQHLWSSINQRRSRRSRRRQCLLRRTQLQAQLDSETPTSCCSCSFPAASFRMRSCRYKDMISRCRGYPKAVSSA